MVVNISQRMPDDLHERVKAFATNNGLSTNVLINQACEYFLSSGGFASFERRMSELERKMEHILSTPASKVSNIADLDVGGIGKVVPLQPETESVVQPDTTPQKPKATGGKPDFLAWADDKNAVPILLDNETQFGKNHFYDGRVDQVLRVSDGKPATAPEKPGHIYHKPIIVPYPYPNEDDSEWQAFIRFGRLWHHQWQDWCEIPIDMPSEIMDELNQNLHDFHLWIGSIEEWEREKEEKE